jgi:hypothetical protein
VPWLGLAACLQSGACSLLLSDSDGYYLADASGGAPDAPFDVFDGPPIDDGGPDQVSDRGGGDDTDTGTDSSDPVDAPVFDAPACASTQARQPLDGDVVTSPVHFVSLWSPLIVGIDCYLDGIGTPFATASAAPGIDTTYAVALGAHYYRCTTFCVGSKVATNGPIHFTVVADAGSD